METFTLTGERDALFALRDALNDYSARLAGAMGTASRLGNDTGYATVCEAYNEAQSLLGQVRFLLYGDNAG